MKIMGKNLEKVNGIRASANRMCGNNPEAYSNYIRDAAGMYESIGAFELAALCYSHLGDHERAGNIYLNKCKKMDEAAECYSEAAEAYLKQDEYSKCLSVCLKGKLFNKGLQYTENWKEQHVNVPYLKQDEFSKCLSVCLKGKLFDKGLQYTENWKEQHVNVPYLKQDGFSKCLSVCLKEKGLQYTENWKEQHVNVQAEELELIIYDFLKKCAFYYHNQNDPESMMKFVRRFSTVGLQRVFLRGMDYIDGPFYLEQELDRSFEVADLFVY